MIKRMKLFFQMRKIKKEMKYKLLLTTYQFISKYEDYTKMIQQLPEIINKFSAQDVEDIKAEIIDKVVDFSISQIDNKSQ